MSQLKGNVNAKFVRFKDVGRGRARVMRNKLRLKRFYLKVSGHDF